MTENYFTLYIKIYDTTLESRLMSSLFPIHSTLYIILAFGIHIPSVEACQINNNTFCGEFSHQLLVVNEEYLNKFT